MIRIAWAFLALLITLTPVSAQFGGAQFGTIDGFAATRSAISLPGGTPCTAAVTCGRDSTNPLKKGFSNLGPTLTGIATGSVTVGTGTKVFTGTDLSRGTFAAGDSITIASGANLATQTMSGSVTSLVGTTLTINATAATGSGTFTDWALKEHLPGGWFTSGGAIRARTGDAIDWNFRGMTENIRPDGTTFIVIRQSLFDACGLTNPDINAPLIDNRNSTTGISITNSELDGCGYTGRLTAMVASANGTGPIIDFKNNKITRAPLDVLDINSTPSVPLTTVQFNYLQSTCTTALAFGLHVDGTQIVGWQSTSNLEYNNNIVLVQCENPATGSGVTGPFNFGTVAGFTGTVNVKNNIFKGGGFSVFTGDPTGCPCGTITFDGNYIADAVFQSDSYGNAGFLYPNQPAYPNLVVSNVRSAVIPSMQLSFRWNNAGVVNNTATSIP